MKKYLIAFVMCAVLPAFGAEPYQRSAQNNSYYSTRSGKTNAYKTSTVTRKTGGMTNTIQNNFYYSQPAANAQYKPYTPNYEYTPNYVPANNNNKKSVVKKTYSTQQMRKYFLAHPFFQPLQGRFGSVTDFAYAKNDFDFTLLNGSVLDIDTTSGTYNQIVASGTVGVGARAETTQFLVKEDFSFGLSDNLAVIAMGQYDKTKVKFKDWTGGEPSDSLSDSGLNVFGIGLQNRFVDNEKWIATAAGFFQHQKDTANTFIAEAKGGYKISRTTLYALARFGYSDLINGDAYGEFVRSDDGDWLMLSYNHDVKNVIYLEGGVGAFAVLGKYVTLNGEAIYGHYDWHNQLSVKGAISVQPGDSFALNIYASTSVYDSAKDKVLKYMNYDVNPDVSNFPTAAQSTKLVYTTGDYKIKDYNEWKIGVQAILYF